MIAPEKCSFDVHAAKSDFKWGGLTPPHAPPRGWSKFWGMRKHPPNAFLEGAGEVDEVDEGDDPSVTLRVPASLRGEPRGNEGTTSQSAYRSV